MIAKDELVMKRNVVVITHHLTRRSKEGVIKILSGDLLAEDPVWAVSNTLVIPP